MEHAKTIRYLASVNHPRIAVGHQKLAFAPRKSDFAVTEGAFRSHENPTSIIRLFADFGPESFFSCHITK